LGFRREKNPPIIIITYAVRAPNLPLSKWLNYSKEGKMYSGRENPDPERKLAAPNSLFGIDLENKYQI
jgi:hypothetical protein